MLPYRRVNLFFSGLSVFQERIAAAGDRKFSFCTAGISSAGVHLLVVKRRLEARDHPSSIRARRTCKARISVARVFPHHLCLFLRHARFLLSPCHLSRDFQVCVPGISRIVCSVVSASGIGSMQDRHRRGTTRACEA